MGFAEISPLQTPLSTNNEFFIPDSESSLSDIASFSPLQQLASYSESELKNIEAFYKSSNADTSLLLPQGRLESNFGSLDSQVDTSNDVLTGQKELDPIVNFHESKPSSENLSFRNASKREIAFIDTGVEDYQELIIGLSPNVTAFILDSSKDGVQQISDILERHSDVSAVHIISHGSSGKLYLGNSVFGTETLTQYTKQIQNWNKSLNRDADLLIYGCDVASGEVGASFIHQLSQITEADIAASTNRTGSSSVGGDWFFEVTHGEIDASNALQGDILNRYNSTFAVISSEDQQAILDGLEALVQFGNDLDETGEIAASLPIVNVSIGETLDIGNILETQLLQRVSNYFDNPDDPSTEELEGATTEGLSELFEASQQDPSLPEFQVSLIEERTKENLNATLNFDFTFGLTESQNKDEFFIEVNSLSTEASLNGISTDAPIRIGLLEAEIDDIDISDPDFRFEPVVGVSFRDPDNNGNRITLSELGDIDNLVSLEASGDLNVNLSVSLVEGNIDLGTIPLEDDINVTSNNIFEGDFNFDGLEEGWTPFSNYTARDLLQMTQQIGLWLDELRMSDVYNVSIPFLDNRKLGEFLNFGDAFEGLLINEKLGTVETSTFEYFVLDDNNQRTEQLESRDISILNPTFLGIQDFSSQLQDLLGDSPVNARYDLENQELKFDLSLDFSSEIPESLLELELGLGLDSLTNLRKIIDENNDVSEINKVNITPTGTFEFTFGIDLSPIGGDSDINESTLLNTLNDGIGILANDTGQADFTITRRDGVSFGVDLGAAETIQDVIDAINNAPGNTSVLDDTEEDARKLVAEFDAENLWLILRDETGGLGTLKIAPGADSFAAISLGLPLDDLEDRSVVFGAPLHDDTLNQHVFLENASLESGIEVSTPEGIQAEAEYGFLGIGIGDGNAQVNASLDIEIQGQGNSNRITLRDLLNAATSDSPENTYASTLTGGANLRLEDISVDGDFLGSLPVPPVISLTINDLLNPSPSTTFNGFGPLNQFRNITFETFLDSLRQVVAILDEFDSAAPSETALLNQTLPFINQSVNDLLDYADAFTDFIHDLEQNPPTTVQELERVLGEALGLLPDNELSTLATSDAVSVKMDGNVLRIDLPFMTGSSDAFGLDIGLAELADKAGVSLDERINRILGLNTASDVDVEVDAIFNLALGIDLSDTSNPRSFLYDGLPTSSNGGTGLELLLNALGSDLEFTPRFGPLAIEVKDGEAYLRGSDDNSPISFALSLEDSASGRRYLDDINNILDAIDVSLGEANVSANLPLILPDPLEPFDLGININDLQGLLLGNATPESIELVLPDFDAISKLPQFNLDNLLRDPDTLVDGLDLFLETLQRTLDSQVFGTTFPLVGNQLKDAAQFIEDFRERLIGILSSDIRRAQENIIEVIEGALFDIFGPQSQGATRYGGGLNLLRDTDGDGDFRDEITVKEDPGSSVEFNLNLGKDLVSQSQNLGFDLGLPALGLDVDAGVDVKLGWDFDLNFGVDLNQGFYINTAEEDELTISLEASLKGSNGLPASAQGRLGFLQVTATDQTGTNATKLAGTFNIDLKDPVTTEENADQLTVGEFLSFSDFLDFEFEDPEARVNLKLDVGFTGIGANFPKLATDFRLDWGFDPDDFRTSFPSVGFYNVGLDIGSFVSDVIGPIINEIQKVTGPVDKVVGFLDERIPLISDLAGQDITLLDIAAAFGLLDSTTIATAERFLKAIEDINDLANDIKTIDGNVRLPLGDLVFGSSGADFNLNLRTATPGQLQNINLSSRPSFTNFLDEITGDNSGNARSIFRRAQNVGSQDENSGSGFQFPILENPASALGLLVGRDADLFTYDMPDLDFEFRYAQSFRILAIIKFTLGAFFGGKFDFDFGYDTAGVRKFAQSGRPEDAFHGFFLSDLDDGIDTPEVSFTAGVFVEGGIDLGIVGGGVGGGLTGTANFDLNDPNSDGKVRFSEIAANVNIAPFCIFDINGNITLDFYAFVEFLFSRKEFELASFTLIEFDASCSRHPILATEMGNGVLRLNMGSASGDRIYGDLSDGDENFEVQKAGDQVKVIAFGQEQLYSNVTEIVADGGNGNDTITIANDLGIKTRLSGGVGNDTIFGGGGNDVIDGGSGNDTLDGRGGDDYVFGRSGNDTVSGGTGNDAIDAGRGNDTLNGNAGNDTLTGGSGNDTLNGNAGNDTYIFGRNWGVDTVNEALGDGTEDRLDFSRITTDLDTTLNEGTIEVVSLSDRVFHGGNEVENITGGRGDDKFNIFATGSNEAELDGFKGSDEYIAQFSKPSDPNPPNFNVAIRDTGNAWDIDEAIALGTSEDDQLTVTDTAVKADVNGKNQTFAYGRYGPESGIETLEVYALEGDDNATTESTPDDDINSITGLPQVTTVFVSGGSGDDILTVGGGSVGTVNEIKGDPTVAPLIIEGNSGEDSLILDDSGDMESNIGDQSGILTDELISGLGMEVNTSYSSIEDVTINLGQKQDQLTVETTITGPTVINGNPGPDLINVETVNGPTTINAGDGDDSVVVQTPDSPETLVVNGDAGNDYIDGSGNTVTSTPASQLGLILNGNDGNDRIFGSATHDLIGGGSGDDFIDGHLGHDELYGDSTFPEEATNDVYEEFKFLGDSMTVPPGERPLARVDLNPGNDTIEGDSGQDTIYGESGDDNLIGGSSVAGRADSQDYIYGGAGNDAIAGDNASISGDRTITNLDASNGDIDILFGDNGEIITNSSFGVNVFLSARSDSARGNDSLSGGVKDDILFGDNGRVRLNFGDIARIETVDPNIGGNDVIHGNEDQDRLIGGAGSDLLKGDAANDLILGDNGILDYGADSSADLSTLDVIRTTSPTSGGNDTIQGNDGNDIALGGAANDNIEGNLGDDILLGDNGQVLFKSSTIARISTLNPDIGGNDFIKGNENSDQILGGFGRDTIEGGTADDILIGDNGLLDYVADSDADPTSLDIITTMNPAIGGNDTIQGNDGNDIALGGAANDNIFGNLGTDILLGDNGFLSYIADPSADPRTLDLITTTDPRFGGRDSIAGGSGDDFAFGGTSTDVIRGNQGEDILFGDHGKIEPNKRKNRNFTAIDTSIVDRGGNDLIFGGDDDDIILGQQGNDTLNGDTGEDDILGGHNVIGGADGNDRINGGADADVALGDNGTIKRNVESDGNWKRYPRPFNSVIRKIQRFDDVDGIGGNDTIRGGSEDDILHGQRGNDVMFGDKGDDDLFGELGNDRLSGGAGQDVLLGDVGLISRSYKPNGKPLLTDDGSWHKNVVLTHIGLLIDSVNLDGSRLNGNRKLARDMILADMLLATGASTRGGRRKRLQNGRWDTDLHLISLLGDGKDIIKGNNGNDLIFGQRGNDKLQGGKGRDYIEGNAGNDKIEGQQGHDTIIGDDSTNSTSFNHELPNVVHGLHLINPLEAEKPRLKVDNPKGIELGQYGTIIVPQVSLVPSVPENSLSPISLLPNLGPDFDEIIGDNVLRSSGQTELSPLISIVPDFANHLDLLSGNDRLNGGKGDDTIIGDNHTISSAFKTGIELIDDKVAEVTRKLYVAGDDLRNLALFANQLLPKKDRQVGKRIKFGQDRMRGGSGHDNLTGDDGLILGPFVSSVPGSTRRSGRGQLRQLSLDFYEDLQNLEHLTVDFNHAVTSLSNSIRSSIPRKLFRQRNKTHILISGNDNIMGDAGHDKVTGDDTLILSTVIDSIPKNPRQFDLFSDSNLPSREAQSISRLLQNRLRGFDQEIANLERQLVQQKRRVAFIQEYDLRNGNDTIKDSSGNNVIFGDYLNLLLPIFTGRVRGSRNRNKLEDTFGEIFEQFKALINDLHEDDHNSKRNNANKVNRLDFGNDKIFGGNDVDILFGDNSTLELPAIQNKSNLSINSDLYPIERNFNVDEDEGHSFNHLLPHRIDFDDQIKNRNVSSKFGEDRLKGSKGEDILFGLVSADSLSGGAGRDYFFGGKENDRFLDVQQDDSKQETDPGRINQRLISPILEAEFESTLSPALETYLARTSSKSNRGQLQTLPYSRFWG